MNFLEEFITPIIKATRKVGRNDEEVISFFSIPEFDEWKNNNPNWNKFTIKYYKGFYFLILQNILSLIWKYL